MDPMALGRPGLSRRAVLRTAAAVAAGGLLADGSLGGCASAAGADGRTVVTVWSWLTGMDKYIAAFNASQRDVHVQLSVITSGLKGGYAQQINAIKANNAPDIMHVEYQALPQMLLTGGMREITADLADLGPGYTPAAWNSVRPDGRTWAVPMDVAPMVFYYRKDLFDAHGIPVPVTWQDFRRAAAAVKAADPSARITTFPLNDGSFFAGMCWQAGDPWWRIDHDAWAVDVNGPGTVRTAEQWQQFIADDLVATSPTGDQAWIAAIHNGRLWGLLGAAWNVGTFAKSVPADTGRWAVATMPTWDGRPANGMQGGSAFAVSKQSTVAEAALTFLRWLSTDPAVVRIGSTFTAPFPGYNTSRTLARSVFRSTFFLGPPVYQVLDEAARRVPDWTWGPNSLGLFSVVADTFSSVRSGQTMLPDAVRAVQARAVADMRGRGLSVVDGAAR
jgi:multiple sugar transport system substrate-binding protein